MTVETAALRAIQAERRRLGSEGPTFERAEGDFERVSIPEPDAGVLRDLLVAEGAGAVIEIGLAYGASALAIAEALVWTHEADARHVIVDAYQDRFGDSGWSALLSAGLADTCSLLRAQSQLALPKLLQDGQTADAAFVDGSHIFHNVFVDLHYLRQLVRPGGLVILDDVAWPSVATAVRYFEVNTGWRPQELPTSTRLQAYRLPDDRIEPSFEDFKPFG